MILIKKFRLFGIINLHITRGIIASNFGLRIPGLRFRGSAYSDLSRIETNCKMAQIYDLSRAERYWVGIVQAIEPRGDGVSKLRIRN